MGTKMDHKMEPKRDRKRVAKGNRNGTETEILLNTNHEESSYATTRKGREDSGLFLGVKVEERQTSKPNSNCWNSNLKRKPELHDDRTRLRKLATLPRDPSLAELPLHFFSGTVPGFVFGRTRASNYFSHVELISTSREGGTLIIICFLRTSKGPCSELMISVLGLSVST